MDQRISEISSFINGDMGLRKYFLPYLQRSVVEYGKKDILRGKQILCERPIYVGLSKKRRFIVSGIDDDLRNKLLSNREVGVDTIRKLTLQDYMGEQYNQISMLTKYLNQKNQYVISLRFIEQFKNIITSGWDDVREVIYERYDDGQFDLQQQQQSKTSGDIQRKYSRQNKQKIGGQKLSLIPRFSQKVIDLEDQDEIVYLIQKNNAKELYEFLVSHPNYKINQQDQNGNNLLIYASQGGYENVVQYLIENKAKLDIQNEDGDTALHKAIEFENYIISDMLTKAGATQNIRNNKNLTPWQQ